MFLSPQKTLRRKITEALLALYVDVRLSKERILTLYLNEIYFGQEGPISVAGVRSATRFFFNKDLRELTLPECALLAGIIRSPHRYNPLTHPKEAKGRRDVVLARMLELGIIDHVQFLKALASPLETRSEPPESRPSLGGQYAYFIDEVVRELSQKYTEDVLYRFGLTVYTTMDPVAQTAAQSALADGAYQAALVAMDPPTGRVIALCGGRNFKFSQFNRATQALRQPGSSFKPFLYGAALEKGFTPATLLHDEKKSYGNTDGERWEPRNYDGVYHGDVPLRQALAHSMNGASLDLIGKIGVDAVIDFAKRMGIERPLRRNMSLALGTSELTPLELVGAYAPFANGGFHIKPHLITAVLDSDQNVLEEEVVEHTGVISPGLAYLMTSLLETSVTEGTAKSLTNLGWTAPTAGKTGTTNGGKDAWFIGYTPTLLAGVWVGQDQAAKVYLAGSKNAMPAWAAFMKKMTAEQPAIDFVKPDNIITRKIDPLSGLLAQSGCPLTRDENFLPGSEPTTRCPLHPGGIKGWWRHLFHKT